MSAPSQADLVEACTWLSERDASLARAYRDLGLPTWRYREPNYSVIARMIAYQQITTKAAASIWARVEDALGTVSTASVLAASDDTLRGCGLSRPKVRHLRSIADAIESGALDLTRVYSAEIDDARAELIAVKGIGPWTADLFLLYCGRLDAFPVGDVGLMEAYKLLSDASDRHDTKSFNTLAESWRPYRGVAAHLLWGWINAERDKASAQ
ncbi:DNA-3-methyladenine glycosylase family protein [Henriciella litoralis]|uniref:DNA-3-methyladenine glycosylase family protein n=1 Tax=Henriciella litoralis TaxID=568102 RepID=UPI000A00FA27|nr:DNA-3-methyladenine glycosylase [Henriciella litoralis]